MSDIPLQPLCGKKEDWLSGLGNACLYAWGSGSRERRISAVETFINERCLSKVSRALVTYIPLSRVGGPLLAMWVAGFGREIPG